MGVNQFDIAVVGSYYNLSWLASELSRQGWRVLYLDLYPQLGRWPMEDIEGPFGFFNSELLNPHFIEKHNYEELYDFQGRGWTIWLPQGPIEFKSSLIPYQLKSLGIHSGFVENLAKSTEEFYKTGFTSDFKKFSFRENWLEYFSHTLSQTEYSSYDQFQSSTYPLPLMNSFSVRSLSRRSLEFSQQWLINQNIKSSHSTSIVDLVFSGAKKVSGFELKGEYSGVIKFDSLVWGLSSEESYFYNRKVGNWLYPKGMVEPEWVWSRYTLDVEINRETKLLPLHSVWISDLYAPWTHENLMIVQRTTRDQFIDVWIKIPHSQRFNKDYLNYYGEKMIQIWNHRFDGTKVSISHYPQEYDYTFQQLGPSRFVQFAKSSRALRRVNPFKNVYFSSYESLENLNKETLYQNHLQIIGRLINALRMEKVRELE